MNRLSIIKKLQRLLLEQDKAIFEGNEQIVEATSNDISILNYELFALNNIPPVGEVNESTI